MHSYRLETSRKACAVWLVSVDEWVVSSRLPRSADVGVPGCLPAGGQDGEHASTEAQCRRTLQGSYARKACEQDARQARR